MIIFYLKKKKEAKENKSKNEEAISNLQHEKNVLEGLVEQTKKMIKDTKVLYMMKDERDALHKAHTVLNKLDALIGEKNLVSLNTGEVITANDIITANSLLEVLLEDAFEVM